MHLATTLIQLAALGVLPAEFAAAVVIPGPRQAHFMTDRPMALRDIGGPAGGIHFYRRRSFQHMGLPEDEPLFGRNYDDDVKLDNEKAPGHRGGPNHPRKRRQIAIGASVHIMPSSEDGSRDGSLVYIGRRRNHLRHRARYAHHRIVNSRMHVTANRPTGHSARRSIPTMEAVGIGSGGLPGTIDIVSPTVDNPVGEKIASLAMSTEPSSLNQFILNASGTNASTVYLHVKTNTTTPSTSSTLTVSLEVPVYDESKASYVPYCATFDTSGPSPLMAMECMADESGVTESKSQIFEYNPATRVIKPLWLAQNLVGDTPAGSQYTNSTQASSSSVAAEDIQTANSTQTSTSTLPSQGFEPLPLMKNVTRTHGPTAQSEPVNAAPQSVELVFTPKLEEGTAVVDSESDIMEAPQDSNDDSSDQDSTATDGSLEATATETNTPGPSPTDSNNVSSPDQGNSSAPVGTSVGQDAPASSDTATGASPTSTSDTNPSGDNMGADNDGGDGGGDEDGSASGDDGSDSSGDGEDGEESSASPNELRSVDTGYGWRFSPSTDGSDLVG